MTFDNEYLGEEEEAYDTLLFTPSFSLVVNRPLKKTSAKKTPRAANLRLVSCQPFPVY